MAVSKPDARALFLTTTLFIIALFFACFSVLVAKALYDITMYVPSRQRNAKLG